MPSSMGYATEALTEVIDFLFSQNSMHRVNRIEAYVMQGNLASETILNKLGFTMEGILREHSYWKGEYHDLSLYALLKKDWL
ncbi:GNAT family N-acetyltransferase [Shewanella surugensis]|uniref:GNAT family N-acetyltransferase n=1 Tax=Shewanella surugensis TaxID=212020 RepID=A0ABT0LBK0_9GAMM|nr:GNAT family protein [Shewanella surugensis]MCL1125038.1 GNAT family N-acetyltransferase [Shewanella surugensis]